jgi:hypothetical protein
MHLQLVLKDDSLCGSDMMESRHVAAAYRYLDARRARRLPFVTKTSSRNRHPVRRAGFFRE